MNDAPALNGGNNFTTITEDAVNGSGDLVSTLISGQAVDVDTGAASGIALTDFASGTGKWQFSIDNGVNWSDVPAVSLNSALVLRSIDRLRLVPDGNNGTTGSVTFSAWDQSDGGTTGTQVDATYTGATGVFSSATATSNITVSDVNDAPVLTGASDFSTITEDNLTSDGAFVFELIAGDVSDVDTVASQGIAIFSTVNTAGTWQFSTDNGQSWSNVGSVSASSALLLRRCGQAAVRARFQKRLDGERDVRRLGPDQRHGRSNGRCLDRRRHDGVQHGHGDEQHHGHQRERRAGPQRC